MALFLVPRTRHSVQSAVKKRKSQDRDKGLCGIADRRECGWPKAKEGAKQQRTDPYLPRPLFTLPTPKSPDHISHTSSRHTSIQEQPSHERHREGRSPSGGWALSLGLEARRLLWHRDSHAVAPEHASIRRPISRTLCLGIHAFPSTHFAVFPIFSVLPFRLGLSRLLHLGR
jgi:hypothetical protein